MNNRHVTSHLSDYLDNRLSADIRRDVERHLESCGDCRRQWQDLQDLSRLIKSSPTYTPPESFYQSVLSRVGPASRRADESAKGAFWAPILRLAGSPVLKLAVTACL